MDAKTQQAYEAHAETWISQRRAKPRARRRIGRILARLEPGARVADLGCGPGWYSATIARRGALPIALDVSLNMLAAVPNSAPRALAVQGDLGALPFARGSLDAAVAYNTYQHLPVAQLPVALADLHGAVRVGGAVDLTLADSATTDATTPKESRPGAGELRWNEDAFPGRLFSFYDAERIHRLLEGAGFENIRIDSGPQPRFWHWIAATRAHTLPDYVRPDLDVLVCGLNPSLLAADTGVPYGRPGNRFWPAALQAGLCARDRDPWAALASGVGFTDFVKRATRGAKDLSSDEYAAGLERLDDCVRFFQPRTICFVGLDGWRRTVDRGANEGWVSGGFADRPAYLMPSTSGLNAHCRLEDFVAHLRRVKRGPRAT